MADLNERRAWIDTLERAAARAWPPHEDAPLSGWRLRCGGARSRRLNSVRTARFEGSEVRPAIEQASAWYRERGLPPCFQLAEGAEPAGLDGRLAARGFAIVTPTTVMQAPAEAFIGESGDGAAVELLAEPTQEIVAALCDPSWPADVKAERAALFARIPAPRRFALLRADGQPAAAGICVADGELAGIFSMRTARAFRRRGLGAQLLRALAAWARAERASQLYLQVEDDSPALPLYQRLGFEAAYAYHYRELA
ncbi:MAG TPA: GNAT family N-acetyltransferase [Myxococcota bacterium]|jgi:GNAT superfamily N-acetyltransferase|nr:GNAT family N-acetyltransferase [Myxococcota bacterium]